MKKKIFSILFALVLVVGLSSVAALANPEPTVTIGDISVPSGGTVTVPITAHDVDSSYEVCQAGIDLQYDGSVVTVINVTKGDDWPGFIFDSEVFANNVATYQMDFGDNVYEGDFVIAYVTFEAIGNPGDSCELQFGDWGNRFLGTFLSDFGGSDIPLTLVDGTFTIVAAVLPMSEFEIDKASIDFGNPDGDKVSVKGTLALANGNGVDIKADDVTVTVGPLSEIIPGDTMVEKKPGEWECKGFGAIKKMKINWNKGKFEFSMDNVNLSGLADPDEVYISLQVGDDLGEETIPMTEKKRWDYKAP